MKWFTLSIILLVSGFSAAQEFPRFELSTGYSYGSYENLAASNQFSPQGWNGSLATNFKRWAAIEIDAGGQYLNKSVVLGGYPYTLKNSAFYSFQAGPRFAFRGEKLTPFAHTLFGIHRTPSYGQAVFPTPTTVVVPYENALGAAVGGGFDFALSKRFALRTQGDYFFTRLTGGSLTSLAGYENRFRVVGGIVLTFGGTGRGFYARRRTPKPASSDQPASAFNSRTRAQEEAQLPLAVPAYATVAPTPAQVPAATRQAAPASPFYQPTPATSPSGQAPAAATATAPPVKGQAISTRPKPAVQEESLGEAARRYRQLKKKQQGQKQPQPSQPQ